MDEQQTYRPELIPTRGEWIAWGLTAACLITWGLIRWRTGSVPVGVTVFTVVFLLAALSIRLSNWMDRHTEIRLDEDGVKFRNGLRKASLRWEDVDEVRVIPARFGERIQVIGERDNFEFRTLGKVVYKDEERGRMGFKEGQQILGKILQRSDLIRKTVEDDVRYYSRP